MAAFKQFGVRRFHDTLIVAFPYKKKAVVFISHSSRTATYAHPRAFKNIPGTYKVDDLMHAL